MLSVNVLQPRWSGAPSTLGVNFATVIEAVSF